MPKSMFGETLNEELVLPGGVIKGPALYRDCILKLKRTPHFFGKVRMLNCIVHAPAGQNMVFHGGPVTLYGLYVTAGR